MNPHMTRRCRETNARRRIGLVAVIFLLGLFAIPLSSSTARAQPPVLTIISPSNGEVIGNGSAVIVTFLLTDFVLVQPGRVGQVVSPNEGHLDVYVDGVYSQLITRVEPIVLSLDSGPHTILLQLKGNDGQPLTPDVGASVRPIVTHGPAVGRPGVEIKFPANQSSTGHDVYFAVVLSNFTLVDPHGRPNAPNEGHLQVRVNDRTQEELSRYEPAFVVDMPDGENTITVRLVNNDNSPLQPNVQANVTIHIKAATATLPEILNFGVTVLLIYILIVLILRRRKAEQKAAPPGDSQ